MRRLSLAGFVLATALVLPVAASAAGCEPIMAARQKALEVPVRTTMTITMPNGLKVQLVTIATGGKIYEQQKDGSWTVGEPSKNYVEAIAKWADKDCTAEGTETIGGEVADILFNREKSFLSQSDQRVWISRTSGMIVKFWSNVGGIQLESVNDYTNVLPPATVAGGAAK
ncbi:MAG: hypothetical protein ABSD74_01885 [Rhizomicrobium sp.]